ncbi:hypothetical protein DSO57_1038813 [Entomophthora muscae]|uniref:Uncharacterized protein n=1 Tax=Entomophthora muscae TaxID=34485 RepID=A0ACC2TXN8_9FUNG|nr:hypothetical protein DSO57_1038813 [Entomophthora muscae]
MKALSKLFRFPGDARAWTGLYPKIFKRSIIDIQAFKDKYLDLPKPLDGSKLKPLTAKVAATYKTPPISTQMLSREFIDDSLYNPHYGYFSKQAVIFSPETSIPFNELRDSIEFLNIVADKYKEIEDDISHTNDIARQVWHTPTELFKPWYGYAIAKHIVEKFLNTSPRPKQLKIYEMGAGNGTLMMNIMDFIRKTYPELYPHTYYQIIEISSKLVERQQENSLLRDVVSAHHNVSIINCSIFEWNTLVPEPCFFIALEVLDNFAHDVIRYDILKGDAPYQGLVLTGPDGAFEEVFEPAHDPLIKEYLDIRKNIGYNSPLLDNPLWRRSRAKLPFAHFLTSREFIPTRAFQFLQILHDRFPSHHLIMSDFFKLPDAVDGWMGPVVQTRYKNTMVPCSTYMVQPGWFDIFFPTDFELFKRVYDHLGKARSDSSSVMTQHDFLLKFGDLNSTTTKSGENPFLTYYENNKFFLS